MDDNLTASSIGPSTSDSLINHPGSIRTASPSPTPYRNVEEFEHAFETIRTATRVTTDQVLTTICTIHNIGHDRLGDVHNLCSKFDVKLDEFEPRHRDALTKVLLLQSQALVAAKDLSDRVKEADAEIDRFIVRNAEALERLEDEVAAICRHQRKEGHPCNERQLPNPQPSDFQGIGSWAECPLFPPESPMLRSDAVSPLIERSEVSEPRQSREQGPRGGA
jgi:hypothetical protein